MNRTREFLSRALKFWGLSSDAEEPTSIELQAGQVWSYKTRVNEVSSTLSIIKIESDSRLGNIVHIAIHDLKISRVNSGGVIAELPHIPIAEEAVRASLTRLTRTEQTSAIPPGYEIWRSAFERGEAGVYSISVADCVATVEESLNHIDGNA